MKDAESVNTDVGRDASGEQTLMRCFIGVPVDASLALALVDARDRLLKTIVGAQPRAVPAANFHLTLAFLGDVEESAFDPIYGLLDTLGKQHHAFAQPLDVIQPFPGKGSKVLAAEGAAVDDLRVLRHKLAQGLVAIGLERPDPVAFRPHITLARMQHPVVPPPHCKLGGLLRVDAMVLFASGVQKNRRVYRMLRRAELDKI